MFKTFRVLLWASTILIVVLSAIQVLSGNWITLYLFWPGGPGTAPSFIKAMIDLANYHRYAGFTIGGISILVLLFAFLAKPNIFVRIISIVGLIMMGLAASGGYLYVTSNTQDRWSLGQMMDAAVGVLIVYSSTADIYVCRVLVYTEKNRTADINLVIYFISPEKRRCELFYRVNPTESPALKQPHRVPR